MQNILVLTLICASGFVASGAIASFYALVTRSEGYVLKPKSDAGRLAAVGLTIFTGPAVLLMNAWNGKSDDQPKSYVWIVSAIALLWSYVLGLFVVSLALSMPIPF